MLLLATLLLASTPCDSHHTAQCDLMEINTHCDSQGREILKQVVFWNWCPASCDYRVSAWCMWSQVKASRSNVILLSRDDGKWLVSGKQVRITRTDYDPEVRDRDYLPSEDRVSLFSIDILTSEE